jgi:F-type H+-transporting ATPase subunit a
VYLSFHLWFSLNISSMSFNFTEYVGHLSPSGSPTYLVSLLNLIEGVSKLIRPITLTLRLTINMTTGHILLNLLNVRLLSARF